MNAPINLFGKFQRLAIIGNGSHAQHEALDMAFWQHGREPILRKCLPDRHSNQFFITYRLGAAVEPCGTQFAGRWGTRLLNQIDVTTETAQLSREAYQVAATASILWDNEICMRAIQLIGHFWRPGSKEKLIMPHRADDPPNDAPKSAIGATQTELLLRVSPLANSTKMENENVE